MYLPSEGTMALLTNMASDCSQKSELTVVTLGITDLIMASEIALHLAAPVPLEMKPLNTSLYGVPGLPHIGPHC